MASLNEIRSGFLSYFERHGHAVVDSSPLVPRNDPTLMFTNSGMVQFKNVFTGLETRDYVRAATSQKCVRAGGKHNDLDNVGYTARHHTFFEMLGNFSFGDYFKEEAIPFSWDLITREFEIPAERLWVTVYHTDDEAADVWRKYTGLPEDRIIRIKTSDNFWMMGPTGPCGPCSEIFYDHGEHIPGGLPGTPEEDGDRFVEIWNLVFMQFEQRGDGSRCDLPKKSIDTGMGLERVGALLQGRHDNYDTDVFRTLIEASARATGTEPDGEGNIHHRVISDHLRSTSFLIADGVLPSNEGRGYVLRRIMRRAMRHAHLLGAREPVMHALVPSLIGSMGQAFPELARAQRQIEDTLQLEEERFRKTLGRGLRMLEDEISGLDDGERLPGETAFRLYDTYGFPLDLTEDILRERKLSVDSDGFDKEMRLQRERARAAWEGSGDEGDDKLWLDLAEEHGQTEFLGHETETAEGRILALIKDGSRLHDAGPGSKLELVFNQTPYYAEAGGQVGDSGIVRAGEAIIEVRDVKRKAGLFAHASTVLEGMVSVGDAAELSVDNARRTAIRANHSAAHLLHEALRSLLGSHVMQRGSRNAAEGLRFDFSHEKGLNDDEIARVESEVNFMIRQNSAVETRIMTPDDARELGAIALFGEKYGDEVRVVSMGTRTGSGRGRNGDTYSMELCGGTHVRRTGEIGLFVTTAETASSSGVRRIEALTGQSALEHLSARRRILDESAHALRSRPDEVPSRVRALADERRTLQRTVEDLRRKLAAGGGADGAAGQVRDVAGISFLAQVVDGLPGKELRGLLDAQKSRLGSGVILLISDVGGKAAIVAGVTDDLTSRVSAVDLVRVAASAVGGSGGGGRPDMAQAGGPDASRANAAVAAAVEFLEG